MRALVINLVKVNIERRRRAEATEEWRKRLGNELQPLAARGPSLYHHALENTAQRADAVAAA